MAIIRKKIYNIKNLKQTYDSQLQMRHFEEGSFYEEPDEFLMPL